MNIGLSKKKKFSIIFLALTLILSTFLVGCDGGSDERPKPNGNEKRICSFIVTNFDSEFSLDKIDLKLRYGINSENNSENLKAGFMAYRGTAETPTVLQAVENLGQEDYSFTVTDGEYTYKRETTIRIESNFFDKTESEFTICLCLFDKDDALYEYPFAGYLYKIKYTINGDKISFEIKSGSVIRNH